MHNIVYTFDGLIICAVGKDIRHDNGFKPWAWFHGVD